jgi:hypothetical protein
MRVEKESSLERESAQRARTPDPLLIRLRHLLAPTPFVPKTRPVGHRETIDLSAPRLASLSVLKTCVCGTRPTSFTSELLDTLHRKIVYTLHWNEDAPSDTHGGNRS